MKKLLLLLTVSLSLQGYFWDDYKMFAKYMHYETSYEKALQRAKKEQKPLFLVVVSDKCPFCKKLMDKTLTNKYVRAYITKKYVKLIMNKEEQRVPKRYIRPFEPVSYIIDPKSNKIINEIDGYMDDEYYLWHL